MPKSLRLLAVEPSDLEIIAAACQDALFLPKEAKYLKDARRFTISINRFVWEHEGSNETGARVDAILSFDGILSVRAKGINPKSNVPLSILNIEFIADSEPPGGEIVIKLAEDYELALVVECIDIVLADIGQARQTNSIPNHEA